VAAGALRRREQPHAAEMATAIAAALSAAAAEHWRASAAPNSRQPAGGRARAAVGVAGAAQRVATPWDQSPAVLAIAAPRAEPQHAAADGEPREQADGHGRLRQEADWANSTPTSPNHARKTPVSENFRATMRGPTTCIVADFGRAAHDFSAIFPRAASPRQGRLKVNMAKGWRDAQVQQTRGCAAMKHGGTPAKRWSRRSRTNSTARY
jgi:hypothetical protein